MRHIIIHYHIFKNAGSTVAAMLERNFADRFASFDSPAHDKRLQPGELVAFVNSNPQVTAISSHHLRPPAPRIEGVQFYEILIFRHPLDRLRSMYDFYRSAAVNQDPLTREAKRLSVSHFFELLIRTAANLVTNAQLNLLANGGARIPDDQDAQRGLAMIKDFAVVGVAENFDECALTAEYRLHAPFPGLDLSYVPENVTRSRANDLELRLRRFAERCGQTLYRRLVELNRLDSGLVAAAAGESERRYVAAGLGAAQLREFRKRLRGKKILFAIARGRRQLSRLWRGAVRATSSSGPHRS
jgi:hypothetical protein